MFRKILDALIITTFLVVFGGATFIYLQRGKISNLIMDKITDQLPELVKGSMPSIPKMPSTTGPVMKF